MRDIIASSHLYGRSRRSQYSTHAQSRNQSYSEDLKRSSHTPDLPEGYFRVVAKAHLIIFQIEGDVTRIVRIVHGARDIPALLAPEAK